MDVALKYFKWPFIVTATGLILSFWLGWNSGPGGMSPALSFLFVGIVLAILEISLSFDNAIVNANKLKDMTPVWQRRFLTWGILIAVFGMRVVFPVLIVVVAARIGPIEAIWLAATDEAQYAAIINEAHPSIAAFGSTFLMMVGLKFFMNSEKDVHWIGGFERWLNHFSSVRGFEVALVLVIVMIFSNFVPEGEELTFLTSAIYGLLTFLIVEVIGHLLDEQQAALSTAAKGGFGAFLYLEVLDASFSFDGVIGAFALTQNLFLIAIGLGIGAMYVRSMTIMLVERQTLAQFRYLEHGAFYSILILSVIMLIQTLHIHVPEVITGLLGAGFIATALWASIRYNRAALNK
ncbi:DUF475 domain-containing protein [Ketogulonicigenium vulgare]|uniref:Putative transmembrane protein n=1 Tax=Ketogulonicigenium vulgare (strain WSH-001) TaxID=759362 RepID=F9Y644_KETVW|nr:DUF475 domain-containing protein [Ketogulonicigenium vulgare]ADO43778.1 conserved hypothetical protein [Ketogulonicigenium vulgare Y25]AEM42041.1 putative transmembrane protein [Ketogulonicigenium vulgare WSH-001]ALJ82137.1 hypothetical protein KVH_13770 [Ketogulonicigenium vulgare]ANW34760.1 hypothetical protein KvSKV_13680 [Ketogulonicigenium vulgare]AOZ55811.1 hypothetical protein KVC_2809 [Ketogulonicigenium vulgare]